jgi:FimV-like protein
VFRKLLVVALISPLISVSATGQDAGRVREATVPAGGSASISQAKPEAGFHLRGVLISKSGRSALINDTLSREGDQVGGARILEITEDGVRIQVGSGELSVPVGARAMAGQLTGPKIQITRNRSRPAPVAPAAPAAPVVAENTTNVVTTLDNVPAVSRENQSRKREVQQGETLAGIALDYVGNGNTLDQVMMSLYEANPHAFRNNINFLYEGALLRIPDAGEVQQHTLTVARAEIRRHMDSWRNAARTLTRLAVVPANRTYGPVRTGETLSVIARKVRWDGATSNQMMMALFAANPRAFDGNINRLQQGAVLQIPDASVVRLQTPETATAEVLRQVAVWRNGAARQARSALIGAETTAANRDLADGLQLQIP